MKVLLLGSSAMSFTESGPELRQPDLVQASLSSRAPGTEWSCEGKALFPNAAMPSRARALVGREQPDAVVLWLTSVPFAEEYLVYGIRQRWPWAYPAALWLAGRLRRASGGGPEGGGGARSLLFRFPRDVAAKIIRAAPETPLDEALGGSLETLADLARTEDTAVVCRLPVPVPIQSGWRAENERRTRIFNEAVAEACERYRFCYYSAPEVAARTGFVFGLGPDGVHFSPESRRFEADVIADLLAAELAR